MMETVGGKRGSASGQASRPLTYTEGTGHSRPAGHERQVVQNLNACILARISGSVNPRRRRGPAVHVLNTRAATPDRFDSYGSAVYIRCGVFCTPEPRSRTMNTELSGNPLGT